MSNRRHNSLIPAKKDLTPQPATYSQVPPSHSSDSKLNFAVVWQAVRDGKWIIAATAFLVIAGITGYTVTLTPTYEATSVVYVDTKAGLPPSMAGFATEARYLATEVGILEQSRALAERVAQAVTQTAEAVGNLEHFPILKDAVGRSLGSREIGALLLERMTFTPNTTQYLIRITATSSSPQEAAIIADRYAEEYEKYSREGSRASIAAAKTFLEEQVEKRRAELEQIENLWDAFAQQKQVVTLGTEGERLVNEVVSLRAQRSDAQFSLEQAQSSLALLRQEMERVVPGLSHGIASTREAESLESKISALNKRIADLEVEAGQYYAVNPSDLRGNEDRIPALADIVRLMNHYKSERDDLSARLITQESDLTERTVGQAEYVTQLRTRIQEVSMTIREQEARVAALDARIGEYDTRLTGLPRQAIEVKQLERQRVVAEQWYTTFLQELQKAMIAEEAELGYVKIIRGAYIPTAPVSPDIKKNVILAVLLGLGLGFGVAFLKWSINNLVHQPEDLEARGYNLIGIIPVMDTTIKTTFEGKEQISVDGRALSTRLLTLLDPLTPVAETYRMVRANIELAYKGVPIRILLVTSPSPGDGKTVTASNLAVAMAQSGRQTLLIDADLRSPSAHRILGASVEPGVADQLAGDVWDPELSRTNIPNLSFLPAGIATTPSADLLGSEGMHGLLKRLRSRYDIIIIDSPPVLAVTDALLLAAHCDGTVMVVSAEKTDLRALDIATRMLEAVGAPIVGTIFNQYVARNGRPYGYAYGYGYGYANGRTANGAKEPVS